MDGRKVLNSISFRVKKAHFQMKQIQIILPLQQRVIMENPFSKAAGSQEPFISHSCVWPGIQILMPSLKTDWVCIVKWLSRQEL